MKVSTVECAFDIFVHNRTPQPRWSQINLISSPLVPEN